MWWILSLAFAVASWFYLSGSSASATGRPRGRVAGWVLLRQAIPVLVLGSGFILEPAIWGMIKGDPTLLQNLPNDIPRAVALGLALGSAIAIVAERAITSNDRLVNTTIASVLALLLVDVGSSILVGRPQNFAFSMAADVGGGALAGAFTALATAAIKRREAR